ncbi:hypothetical protein JQX13_45000 [Archangium violaceum]|uniref:hypothetical protein n=1 Tax=Archangium violaceum TaxID=83451 RepID=UPI00193BF8B3|nr:hypothetical protein [Archangium violaceum]QRK07136.1 hypothetical protein JQX13_45000 [Archangium violaceum]
MLAQPFSPGASLRNGWRLFSHTFPQLVPIALLMGIPSGLISHAIDSNGASRLFDVTIGLISIGAYLALMVGVAEGTPSSVGSALKEGVHVWPRLFAARFRSGLWILLFTLLLIVPGIMKALSLAVATEAAYRERQSDALENSIQLTTGRRWELFGLSVVYYFIFLAVVLVIGLMTNTLAGLHANAAPLASIVIDTSVRLAEAFTCGVMLAAFYGLKRSQGQGLEPLPASSARS